MTNPAKKNRRSRPDLGQLREDGNHDSLYRQAERTRLEGQFPGSFDTVGHDACGILCKIRKTGEATHGNVVRALEELVGCPLAIVSTGPGRESTMILRDPFA